MDNNKTWILKTVNLEAAARLQAELNISRTLSMLLCGRGIDTYDKACAYLYAGLEELSDPWIISGMEAAVQRIDQAISHGEKIVIYGDYDVDGVCSTVLMLQCLERLGCKAEYYVPDRFSEGYGLNLKAIEELANKDCKLLISVDSGITSIDETRRAAELGMDVIITDHHIPGSQLPEAAAIINPKLDKCEVNYHLAGAGVVFKLCQALSRNRLSEEEVFAWLDLVALATVADVVPLVGDNRILVKYGLSRISTTTNAGLQALIKACALEGKKLNTWHLAFMLGPRINSAGRMKTAALSVELLQSSQPARTTEIAGLLCQLNDERRSVESAILQDAILQIEGSPDEKRGIIVLAADNWHQGVTGIVASRLCERYNLPVIMISWDGDTGRGSCRSVPGFDIYQALIENNHHLLQYGGHRLAAGLSLRRDEFEQFKSAIKNWALQHVQYTQTESGLNIDMQVEITELIPGLLRELELMQPFGEGNPQPVLLLRRAKITSARLIGKQQEHFICKVDGLSAVAFRQAYYLNNSTGLINHDIAFFLEENDFGGNNQLRLRLHDIKPSFVPDELPRTTGSSRFFNLAKMMEDYLSQSNNIMLVFPTFRTLEKSRPYIDYCFSPEAVSEIHGRMPVIERQKRQKALLKGQIPICLITRACCRYLLNNRLIPDFVQIVELWPYQADEEWQELVNLYHIKQVKGNFNVPAAIKNTWNYNHNTRALVYSNRPSTVQYYAAQDGSIIVEAGMTLNHERLAIRKHFNKIPSGVLISDGVFYESLAGKIDELVFADAPFNIFEILNVMEQIAAVDETHVYAVFARDALDFNRTYLERIYPGQDLVYSFWGYLLSTGENPVYTSMRELLTALMVHKPREWRSTEIDAITQVLSELDLCTVEKKGSIMAIKLFSPTNRQVDINHSLYYLEGLAEKKAFQNLETELNKYMAW